jgi:hypothetical protein
MAIVNIENVKAKFESGDNPRSSDYIDMIDTLAALPEPIAGSTSIAGVVQLTDSTSSTSTTTAATPNSVKSTYDLAAGAIPFIRPISGAYYRSPVGYSTGATPTANITNYLPIFFPTTTTIDRIGCLTAGTFSGTASVRLGIYNNNDGRPGTLLLDAGTVAPTAASTGYQITISQVLSPGLYWVAFNTITAASTNVFYGTTNSATAVTPTLIGQGITALTGNAGTIFGFQQSVNVTSGYANPGTLINHNQHGGHIYLRIA